MTDPYKTETVLRLEFQLDDESPWASLCDAEGESEYSDTDVALHKYSLAKKAIDNPLRVVEVHQKTLFYRRDMS